MSQQARSSEPCQGRAAIAAADRHHAGTEAAEHIRNDVLGGLAGFTDSVMNALGGDFLAESDERRLRDKYRNQPATQAARLSTNRRTFGAERALHVLYNKLLAGAALSIEEQAHAEHARDLAEAHAAREVELIGLRGTQ